MSWSVSFTGPAADVIRQLDEESGKLTDQSKAEYDEALPALKALVGQNTTRTVSLQANGHGTYVNGEKTVGECRVTLA
jgi:hypothetical protein